MDTTKILYKRILIRSIILLATLLFLYFVVPAVYNAAKPVFIAFIVALITNPMVRYIDEKLPLKRKFATFIVLLFIAVIMFILIFVIIENVIVQAQQLAASIQSNWPLIVDTVNDIREDSNNLEKYIPEFAVVWVGSAIDTVLVWIETFRTNILSTTISFTTNIISGASGFFVGAITFIMALVFLLIDFPKMSNFFEGILTVKGKRNFEILKVTIFSSVGSYIKSQLILATTCFIFMSTLLGIYKQDYFLLIGIFLGIIDFIPIIGAIAIMIPWSIILFSIGLTAKGFYILTVGIAFYIVRKLLEPRVMSSQSGVHPLISLISMYIGYQVYGVLGAVFAPIVAVFFVTIYRSGILDDWILDIRDFIIAITEFLRREDTKYEKDKKKSEILNKIHNQRKRNKKIDIKSKENIEIE